MTPFPVLDLRFEAELEGPLSLPPYAGGLLRGAFGAALRHLSCMTGFRNCEGCPLRSTCPFPQLFDPPPADLSVVGLGRAQVGVPPPFILRLPESDPGTDGRLAFGMRLVGHGIDRLAFVIEAWRRALARGLGHARVRGQLRAVVRAQDGFLLWDGDDIVLPPPLDARDRPLPANIMILTRTPWRLMARGAPVPADTVRPRMLVAAIVRRARLLAIHGSGEAQAMVSAWPVSHWLDLADQVAHRPTLCWRDWHRWSARQRQRMNLGGLVGQWQWRRVPEGLGPVLRLGAQLHVGKEASFGLGAFDVLPLPVD